MACNDGGEEDSDSATPAVIPIDDYLNSCYVALGISGDFDGSREGDGGNSFVKLIGAQQSRKLGAGGGPSVDGDTSGNLGNPDLARWRS